ncbi:hypothetical protein CPT_MyoSmar_105 [Serratia phage MyoSmar]|uniref:Uncharacterized protein n=1 Tax=Serratia phage MyoSmar TaxID=2596673 RepID=A0A5B9N6A5_9CAUD|nr:hypothetical protein HWC56_gp105 [Serratia phage MyoSmar]QEG09554.1 hypothetical protein CPT_MyoSmar_105 [Serratia phage MyoSmar]
MTMFFMLVLHLVFLFVCLHLYFERASIELYGVGLDGRKRTIAASKITKVECFWLLVYITSVIVIVAISVAEWVGDL